MKATRTRRAAVISAAAAVLLVTAIWYCSGRGYGPNRKRALHRWVTRTQPGSGARGPLKAGAHRVDITPPVGVPLAGYGARHGRPSRGVRDHIYARALVLTNGRDKLAIVSCDLIGISERLRKRVLHKLRKRGFTNDNLLICATHSHSSPGGLAPEIIPQLFIGRFDPEMPRFVVERIAAAVEGADDGLLPASIGCGVVEVPGLIDNRRPEDPVQLVNPDLTVMKVVTERNEPLAVLCNYSAHATCIGSSMLISGDYPGYLQRAVEKALGGESVGMFAIGTNADQRPRCPVPEWYLRIPRGADRIAAIRRDGGDRLRGDQARLMGEGLAAEALRILPEIEVKRQTRLAARTFRLRLPLRPLSVMVSTSTVVQAIAINDFLILAVPGEMAAEIGARLKDRAVREMGFDQAAVFGIANDHVGYYILTPEQMRRGGYEAAVSFYGPQFGPLMEDAMAHAALAVRKMIGPPEKQPGLPGVRSRR